MQQTSRIESFDQTRLFERIWTDNGLQHIDATLLCLHGNFTHSGQFELVGEYFAQQGLDCIAYDLRGIGLSDKNKQSDLSLLHQHQEDLRFMVNRCRARNPDQPLFILGESLGGTLALVCQHSHDLDVDGFVFIAPGIQLNLKWWGIDYSQSWVQWANIGFTWMENYLSVGALDLQAWQVVFQGSASMNANSTALSQASFHSDHIQYAVEVIGKADVALACIHQPLFVLHGTEDLIVSFEGSNRLIQHACTQDKILKSFQAGHDLLHSHLQNEVLAEINQWVLERLVPNHSVTSLSRRNFV